MPIFASVFLALNQAGIPFLVVGGHAVVLHGHLRNTFDLDLLMPDSKLVAARAAFGQARLSDLFRDRCVPATTSS